MTRIIWNALGTRFYETGVDRGVLFTEGNPGVSWSGLISVNENPTGGTPTPFYMNGVKYLNVPSNEEFEANLSAFTYPDEFEECDGVYSNSSGLSYGQQPRKPFGLSYRTLIGNDVQGHDHGYKIHLVYDALASPSNKNYTSMQTDPEAIALSWNISTTPRHIAGVNPTAHLTLDTRTTNDHVIFLVEQALYGSDTEAPRMPEPEEMAEWFALYPDVFAINADYNTTMWPMVALEPGDVAGDRKTGRFVITANSRLKPSPNPDLYSLEP